MIGGAGTLTLTLAAALLLALIAYALLGGADYGGGVWDLFASGERKERQRALIADAIGPVWEANHVWLILVVVLLFTVFPPAFARLTTVLHVPLALMLIGIVLRGSAFTFRTYDDRRSSAQGRWGRVFAIASVITPLLLGTCIGAIFSGRVGQAWALVAASRTCARSGAGMSECAAVREAASFSAVYLHSWLTPFAVATGVLALAMFAFLAAVYLTVEAPDDDLRRDFRARALAAAAVTIGLAALLPVFGAGEVALLRNGLLGSPWSYPLLSVTAGIAVAAVWTLVRERYRAARVAAAALVTMVLVGWGVGQLPLIVPPDLTIAHAAAPRATQRLVAMALIAGALVLVPSLWYLFRIFKGRPAAFERFEH